MKPLILVALSLAASSLSTISASVAVAESADETRPECADDLDLRDLLHQAQRLVKAEDYLRAHVALQRIDELRRFGDRCLRGAPGYADRMESVRRLSEAVAAHLDLTVEQHEGYFLYRYPGKAKPWTELLPSLEKQPRDRRGLVLRVFLEDPSQEELIQLSGERDCQMLKLPEMVGSRYSQIADGGPAVIERLGHDRCCFRIGTLRHGSPKIEASFTTGQVTVLGDIVLLQPSRGAMGRLEFLLDTHQVETADPAGPPRNRFLLGPITAGGPYGLTVSFPDNTCYDAGPFTPGRVWIVWGRRPLQRWQIDLSAGKTTRVQIHLTRAGELGETIMTQHDDSAAAVGHQEDPLSNGGRPPADEQSLEKGN